MANTNTQTHTDAAQAGRRYFASGSNTAGQIRGFDAIGHAVGTVASKVRGKVERALLAVSVPVFVDSGAFSEVVFPEDGPPVLKKEITNAQWMDRIAAYRRLGETLGGRLLAVAPDRVGSQEITLDRQRRYAFAMRGVFDSGAEVLVPLQRGALDLVEMERASASALGVELDDFVVAIPFKKKATSLESLEAYLKVRQPRRVHMLGMGPGNNQAGAVFALFARLSPNTVVTLDSCLIRANVGRTNGPGGGPRKLTTARDVASARLTARGEYSVEAVDELAIQIAFGASVAVSAAPSILRVRAAGPGRELIKGTNSMKTEAGSIVVYQISQGCVSIERSLGPVRHYDDAGAYLHAAVKYETICRAATSDRGWHLYLPGDTTPGSMTAYVRGPNVNDRIHDWARLGAIAQGWVDSLSRRSREEDSGLSPTELRDIRRALALAG